MHTYSIRRFWSLALLSAVAFVASMIVATPFASAAQSPAGCTADNSVVNISSSGGTAVVGDVITFTVSAGNPASGNGCDIEGRTVTLTLPDGSTYNYGPSNYPNPTATAVIGDEDYVADVSDLDGGVWEATVSWNGTLKSVSDLPSNGSKGVSVFPVLPLEVVKTAVGTYDRDWTWDITKSVDEEELLLAEGETFTVNYDVDVDADATDKNHRVEGTITITNPDGNADATIDSLDDIVDTLDSGAEMDIDCETVGWPVILNGGDSLYCTYGGVADGDEDENTVVVTTSGEVPGNSDTVAIDWADEPTEETDECIVVDDTNANGPQDQQVCASDAPENFSYSVTFGPADGDNIDVIVACDDDFVHPNTASFVTNDSDTTDDADANVHVVVNCVQGCTLTQGYWKTHNDSFKGGAPTDDNWEMLGASKEATGFFTTVGSYPVVGPNAAPFSWFKVFWTAPKGNVYYNLAHQYMAAKLNVLNGATAPANVATAIASAEGLFATKTPTQASGLKGAAKNTWTTLAGTLGSYNEGKQGVPHCDEQNSN